MAEINLFHGPQVFEVDEGSQPISLVDSTIIGLVGTARYGEVNKNILLSGSAQAAAGIFGPAGQFDTIVPSVRSILNQVGQRGARIVAVRIPSSATVQVTKANSGADQLLVSFGITRGTGTDEDREDFPSDFTVTAVYQSATTLAEDIDDAATEFDVASASAIEVGSYLRIGSEYMIVTGKTSNTLTVTRAALSSTAASHLNGVGVDLWYRNTTDYTLDSNTLEWQDGGQSPADGETYIVAGRLTGGIVEVRRSAGTLSAAIVASDTRLTLSGNAPPNGATLRIGDENMTIVSGGGTTTVTVSRSANGITAKAYAAGTAVSWVAASADYSIAGGELTWAANAPTNGSTYTIEYSINSSSLLANAVGGQTNGQNAGVHVLRSARNDVKVVPRILLAPFVTGPMGGDVSAPSPVATELLLVAEALKAIVFIDGPNTTATDARDYAAQFGSRRAMVLDPWVVEYDSAAQANVTRPPSPVWAGVTVRTDQEIGAWASPSNKEIRGIVGTSRPIAYELEDTSCEAQTLNRGRVSTIIQEGAYRTWGRCWA